MLKRQSYSFVEEIRLFEIAYGWVEKHNPEFDEARYQELQRLGMDTDFNGAYCAA